MIADHHSRLSALVFGLLIECPCGAALPDCPLRPYRDLVDLEEKFLLANGWSVGKLDAILNDHNRCYWMRLHLARQERQGRLGRGDLGVALA